MHVREILCTVESDGSAVFTVSTDRGDHRFSAAPVGDHAVLTFEETQYARGSISSIEPGLDLFETVMQSDEMSNYLDRTELRSVQRETA